MECPLCDAGVDGEGGLVELDAGATPEAAAACFSFAAFHLGDAQPVFADAVAFARAQTALYGTRELWLRDKDAEALQRRVVEAENKLHSCISELHAKGREAADLSVRRERSRARERERGRSRTRPTNALLPPPQEKLVASAHARDEADRKVRNIQRMYNELQGRGGAGAPGATPVGPRGGFGAGGAGPGTGAGAGGHSGLSPRRPGSGGSGVSLLSTGSAGGFAGPGGGGGFGHHPAAKFGGARAQAHPQALLGSGMLAPGGGAGGFANVPLPPHTPRSSVATMATGQRLHLVSERPPTVHGGAAGSGFGGGASRSAAQQFGGGAARR